MDKETLTILLGEIDELLSLDESADEYLGLLVAKEIIEKHLEG